MKVPEPLDAQILDEGKLKRARVVMAAILVVVRAARQRKAAPVGIARQLDALTPEHYLWHWLAWKMGGFKIGVDLAVTPDCKVVVIHPHEIIYGDPMTEEVTHLPVRSKTILDAAPSFPAVVEPHSKYRVH
jgi:hypothetical protein